MMLSSIKSITAFTLAAYLLVSSGCNAATTEPNILILGDSLSAGLGLEPAESWVTLLQNRLSVKGYGYTVVNASISGDTTGGGLRRLPRALEVHRPAIVIIELGGNDGLRGTPVMVIRSNLSKLIDMAQDAGAKVILAGMVMPPNYGASYTNGFANVYSDLADEYDAALIPFFMKNVALDPSKMQRDQIHPNAKGQPILLDNVWSVLEALL